VANLANYTLTGPAGNLTISNAVLDTSQTNVILSVSPMTPGLSYTLTVNNVTDQSAAAQSACSQQPGSVHRRPLRRGQHRQPGDPGSAISVGDGYDVTGVGTNIAGISDQFFFNYQPVAGDFDLKVRVQALTLSDLWAKAGLMARESVTANSRMAMAVATARRSRCLFPFTVHDRRKRGSRGAFPGELPQHLAAPDPFRRRLHGLRGYRRHHLGATGFG